MVLVFKEANYDTILWVPITLYIAYKTVNFLFVTKLMLLLASQLESLYGVSLCYY